MILLLTNSDDSHAELVARHLQKQEFAFFRLDCDQLLKRFSISAYFSKGRWQGTISSENNNLALSDVKVIWWRRPVEPINSGEKVSSASDWMKYETFQALNWLLSQLPCAYLSHPLAIRRASNKFDQLVVAAQFGLLTPTTLLTHAPNALRTFIEENAADGVIYKPFSRMGVPTDQGYKVIFTNRIQPEHLEHIASVSTMLHQFQTYIPKRVELRVTVVGSEVFPCEIHSQDSPHTVDDWRKYDVPRTPHLIHELPLRVSSACISMIKHYGLEFGAFDFVLTPAGEYVFLELNPNGQWQWIEMLTGLPISRALATRLNELRKA